MSLDSPMDSDGEDKLIDDSNIEELIKRMPQGTDKNVLFLDNLLAMLPNRYEMLMFSITPNNCIM